MRKLFFLFLLSFIGFSNIVVSQTLKNQRKSTTELSKDNIKNNEERKKKSPGPDEISKDDPNYKDLKAIRNKCVAIKKNGKRCNLKTTKGTTYCIWHSKNNYGY